MEKKSICIVGAGVSGLATCKHLVEKGFRPIVFESDRVVGGVWNKTLASTRLQTPKRDYQYSDHPWPETMAEENPNHWQVMEYIKSYALRFDLLRYVRFGEKVVAAEYVGATASEEEIEAWEMWAGNGKAFGADSRGKWRVTVTKEEDGSSQVYEMNFVILCIGRFSGLADIPNFPTKKGPEIFNGEVIHSMDYSNMGSSAAARLIKGKHVAIIGFKKSAIDIAAECAKVNGAEFPCTIIIRTKRWILPKFMAWGISLGYLYLNRFSELLFHKPGEGILLSFLATLLCPLAWLITKLVEGYFKSVIPMKKYGMVPEHNFFEALSSCQVCLTPEKFYDKVEEGSIVLRHSKSFEFCNTGIMVDGEASPINVDLVIFATGYKGDQKLRDIFVSPHFQRIVAGPLDHSIPLYRKCIHPKIPQLAIIGYSENFSNLFTSEMRARWLAHFLGGGFVLPSIKDMEEDVEKWDKHMKKYLKNDFRRSCITTVHIWYYDQLCKDMGCNPRRKKGFLADWFLPYKPADYANLEDELTFKHI